MAMETGIAPNELIDAPPAVLDRMVGLLSERAEQEKHERLRARLRAAAG